MNFRKAISDFRCTGIGARKNKAYL